MTEYEYSRNDSCISSVRSMSTIFSEGELLLVIVSLGAVANSRG